MKKAAAIIPCLLAIFSLHAQYYLRGDIKDEANNSIANVRILLQSNGYIYYSGSEGAFGITIPQPYDSVTLQVDGYRSFSAKLDAASYHHIILKPIVAPQAARPSRLMSFTKNLRPEDWHGWTVGAETYSSLVENDFLPTAKYPETGFALNIDKASYSNVRRFLNMSSTVPPDAVRIEEMLNYFNFDYVAPLGDSVFTFRSAVSECPWNADNMLLYLQVCAKKVNTDNIPPANLVFLVDVSGSMDLPNRLPLLKSAFKLMVNNLRDKDTVSIVVYGGTVGVWMPPTPGNDKKKILKAIEDLEAGGATPGEAGIRAAYRLAKSQFIKGGNNRVILATDGDFNVGQQTEDELDQLITQHKQSGIYLTCLGVGMGNYKDSKLEILAKRGNGNFAYLDNQKEAEKVLLQEFTQTVYSVADDAYLDISFNTDVVSSYRLIGFDNKLKALSDTTNTLQGGEVGSGHSLMAMFEFTPRDLNADEILAGKKGLAQIKLHYKLPGETGQKHIGYRCPFELIPFAELPQSYRFASATALFGGLLKGSRFVKQASWMDAITLATQNCDNGDEEQKELVTLITKAKKIYAHEKKRKKPE